MLNLPLCALFTALVFSGASLRGAAEIERIWLSHASRTPDRMVVSWETAAPGNSIVEYGTTAALGKRAVQPGHRTLHHVEIPLEAKDAPCVYRVRSGEMSSGVHRFNGYPADEMRVAVVGDIGFAKADWSEAVRRTEPHLLLSAGDNVPSLHAFGKAGDVENTAAFSRLIDLNPALFRSTPFLPVQGNHDREIRPRTSSPPPEPVYDTNAIAFRRFFALPDAGWKWHFDLPQFGTRFVALDLHHLSDFGTTWQSGQAFQRGTEQFEWYRELIGASRQPYVITLYNERNVAVRNLEKGEWGRLIAQGSIAITGFGHFAERAEANGITWYNTSVNGTGSQYPDPHSEFLKSENSFLLLTFRVDGRLVVEIKNLSGATLDRKEFRPRSSRP